MKLVPKKIVFYAIILLYVLLLFVCIVRKFHFKESLSSKNDRAADVTGMCFRTNVVVSAKTHFSANSLAVSNRITKTVIGQPVIGVASAETEVLEKARQLLIDGKQAEALVLYKALLISTKDAATLKAALAKYFIITRDTGAINSEIVAREKEFEADPGNIRLMEILAYLYQYSMSADKEIEFRETLFKKTSDTTQLGRLASLYEDKKDLDALAGVYGIMAGAGTQASTFILLKKAQVEVSASHPEEAQRTCESILASKELSNPNRARAAAMLGQAGGCERALHILDECVRVSSSPAERDLCLLEIYRIKIAQGLRDDATVQALSDLAYHGSSLGVRLGAEKLKESIQ